jgi:hypothetical protein
VPTASANNARQRGKTIEENVEYAVSHVTRSQILVLLHQGVYATAEIADTIREPLNSVGNHIRALLKAGSIQFAGQTRRRNTMQHFYTAVTISFRSEEKAKKWDWTERQETAGLVIQSLLAEIMVALWAGKLFTDSRDWLTWERFELDGRGRQELYDEQTSSWQRLQAIKVGAAARSASSGAKTNSYVVSVLGFEGTLRGPEQTYSVEPE